MSEKMTAEEALDRLKSIYLNRDGSYTVGHKFLYEFEIISTELESLRRDAERYRHIRGSIGYGEYGVTLPCGSTKPDPKETDAAIDAALEADNDSHD